MNIWITGDESESLAIAAGELQQLLRINIEQNGVLVDAQRARGALRVCWDGVQGKIQYSEGVHFFRGLGLLVERMRQGDAGIGVTEETPQFTYNGTMIDASRNAVPTVAMVKQILRSMALMGLNGAMLYTEDTYEVPERPYFGYMRGRYTAAELREMDDYAAQFGIELVPCIQTLGHLAQALKWDPMMHLRDTEDVLLVGAEETYTFIEQMITAATSPLRSKRIHIGMDEAFGIGLGRSLQQYGYRERFDMMNEHLNRVLAITDKLGLQPMIWSDMYFHLLMKSGGHYYDLDMEFSEDALTNIPKNVRFVYWDYYHDDQAFYEQYIEKHRKFGSDPIFAGGIWTWGSISPNYGKTWQNTNPALLACKKQGIQEVFATAWGDNGQETNHLAMLLGLQLFAEHSYTEGEVDEERLKERFRLCTEQSFDDYWQLTYMDETPGVTKNNMHSSNASKFLLWQDPLIGLFDSHIEGELEEEMVRHYTVLSDQLREAQIRAEGTHALLFNFYAQLAATLARKATLGLNITRAYRSRCKDELSLLARLDVPETAHFVDSTRRAHRALWMATNKPFGWEVLDIRYGGVLARLQSTEDRLYDYIEGRLEHLEELEAERLPFKFQSPPEEHIVAQGCFYHRVATAAVLSAT